MAHSVGVLLHDKALDFLVHSHQQLNLITSSHESRKALLDCFNT